MARAARGWLRSLVGLGGALAVLVAACTEGTTPDCRSPDAGCGPGVDGSAATDAAEGGAEAAADAFVEAAQEGGGGVDASDAGADSAGDAALDADAQGG
jgi:hypothetical protein